MAGTVVEVSSEADLHKLCSSHNGLTSILMWASWHPPSVHLARVLEAVAGEHKTVRFGRVNTDVCPNIASTMGADQVPFVAFLDPRGKKIDSIAGADPPRLVEKVKALAARPIGGTCKQDGGSCGGGGGGSCGSGAAAAEAGDDLNSKLMGIVNYSPVMLCMKGSKAEPFCGFSKQAVAVLNKSGIEYSTFDILQDEEVRQGLKDYANFKTYPQLYVKGVLLGGIDIMNEMEAEGSLQDTLADATKEDEDEPQDLKTRLKGLVNKAPVMLFMKGNKEQPHCGFSRKAVAMLNEHNIEYDTFDILGDDEVRGGLKEYSNWKTYPQLYIKGKLIGGLDIMQEMEEDGSLMEEVAS